MKAPYFYIPETTSTNQVMKDWLRKSNLLEGTVVYTDYQTGGKGQGSNSWESERGKNLLFSVLLRPHHLSIQEQFLISQIVSISIIDVFGGMNSDVKSVFSVKWPNDIYWKDKKIGGILIENTLQGRVIQASVVGIGLNINQNDFNSDAPNPASLNQIMGKAYPLDVLLKAIVSQILRYYSDMSSEEIRRIYKENLYRKQGYHLYQAGETVFSARILDVAIDGRLMLEDPSGEVMGFYFKEVTFISSPRNPHIPLHSCQ